MENHENDKIERMHTKPKNDMLDLSKIHGKMIETPISKAYPVIDTDLARDNIENDLTEADKQDL